MFKKQLGNRTGRVKDWKYQIQFISIDWRRYTTEDEMAFIRLWASPITLRNMDNMGDGCA